MSLSLLTFNNDIMGVIVSKLDTDSHLIVGLVCKEMYKILKTLKTFNGNKKLSGSLKYLTSTLNLLKYAHENGCPLNNRTIDNIFTSNESLECLKYFHHENSMWMTCIKLHGDLCYWEKITCDHAAAIGQLECLKYAHENGCPWSQNTTSSAADNGQLECLKYAHENGCPWAESTCSCAAYYGHLECLKYAHENGCPLQQYTSQCAAKNGHLKCLKYLHENGCPWHKDTYSCAAERGHLECVKYCNDNGCPE